MNRRSSMLRSERVSRRCPGRTGCLCAMAILSFASSHFAFAQNPFAPSESKQSLEALSGSTAAVPVYGPQTATDPKVPLDQLMLMVKPLTKDELVVEAKAWLVLVKAKVKEISDLEISVKRKNDQIESVQRLSKAAEEASNALKEAEQEASSGKGDPEALRQLRERAEKASQEAKQAAEEIKAAERKTAGDDVDDATKAALRRAEAEGEGPQEPAADAGTSSLKPGTNGSKALESVARQAEQAGAAKAEGKGVIP